MAGRTLELIFVFSRAGGLALAVAALGVLILASKWNTWFIFYTLLWYALFDGAILWYQVRWLCLGGEIPGNFVLLVLITVEWVAACCTFGMACAAITVDQFALQYHYCASGAACVLSLVAAAMACVAGALAAVSALVMLWVLGSRFRPAQAP